jgi:hypothetical protein
MRSSLRNNQRTHLGSQLLVRRVSGLLLVQQRLPRRHTLTLRLHRRPLHLNGLDRLPHRHADNSRLLHENHLINRRRT